MHSCKSSLRSVFVGLALVSACAFSIGAAEPAGKPGADEKVSLSPYEKVEVLEYPWGWIRWTFNDKNDPDAEMTFGVVYVKPHQINPAHIHPNSAEYLHVLEGSCEHLVGKKWVKLKAGDTLRIPKDVPHRARTGDEACKVIVVYNTGRRQFVEVEDQK